MANIFQRIIYKPHQCKILDFIKDHSDNVIYSRKKILDGFGVTSGYQHTVRIITDGYELNATFLKLKHEPHSLHYSFVCEKNCDNELCVFQTRRPFTEHNTKFASRIYDKMLNYYVAQNGLPRC